MAQGKKSGAEILVKGTNDAAGQTNAMLAYVGAKVDAIIVDPIDAQRDHHRRQGGQQGGHPGDRRAVERERRQDRDLHRRPRDRRRPARWAKDAVNYCKGKNPCEIGIIEGIRADQSGAEENKAFLATIKPHKNIKVVGQGETQYDPAKALNLATNLLTAHPGIDYLYAWWDPGGAAAVQAIQAKGKLGKIGVASQNGDCIQLGHVLKGNADA